MPRRFLPKLSQESYPVGLSTVLLQLVVLPQRSNGWREISTMKVSIIDYAILKISCAANFLWLQVRFKLYTYINSIVNNSFFFKLRQCLFVCLFENFSFVWAPFLSIAISNRLKHSFFIWIARRSLPFLLYVSGFSLLFNCGWSLFSLKFHLACGHHQALCLCRWISLLLELLSDCMLMSFDGCFSCCQLVERPITLSLTFYCWKTKPPLFSAARPLCSEYHSLVAFCLAQFHPVDLVFSTLYITFNFMIF